MPDKNNLDNSVRASRRDLFGDFITCDTDWYAPDMDGRMALFGCGLAPQVSVHAHDPVIGGMIQYDLCLRHARELRHYIATGNY